MADPNNEYPVVIQFLHSPVFIGIAISFVTILAGMFGRHLTPEQISTYANDGIDLVTLGALGYAAYKRWRSGVQPLTLTKAKADAINSAPLVVQQAIQPPPSEKAS